MSTITSIRRDDAGRVVMLDQRRLPFEEIYETYETGEQVAEAIRAMVIRGAPAIGVAAAMGLALGARLLPEVGFPSAWAALCERMAASRPTAVNLFWAIDRMRRLVDGWAGAHAALLDARARRYAASGGPPGLCTESTFCRHQGVLCHQPLREASSQWHSACSRRPKG